LHPLYMRWCGHFSAVDLRGETAALGSIAETSTLPGAPG
jgi:hypothetical protein